MLLFARLKVRLMLGSVRRDSGRLVGFVLSLVAVGVFAPIGFAGMALLRGHGSLAVSVGVVAFTGLATAWPVLSLMVFGADETLDPTRLTLLPLRRGEMARGMLVASVIGPGPLFVVIVLAGSVVGLSAGLLSVGVGVIAMFVELTLCVTLSRALTAAMSGLLLSRRGRDLAVLVGLTLVVGLQLGNLAFQHAMSAGAAGSTHRLTALGATLRWTPPGAAAHAVTDAAAGSYGTAAIELVAACAAVALLAWGWIVVLGRSLVSHDASTEAARRTARARAPRTRLRLPRGRVGGVAGMQLRYVWRDPRRKAAWLSTLCVGVIASASVVETTHARPGPLLPVCLVAAMAGLQSANQFGQDGPSIWMNVTATGSAADVRSDLAGRNLAQAIVALPCVAILSVAAAAISGAGVGAMIMDLAVGAGVLGVALGVANLWSVLFPYALPQGRGNPFGGPGAGRGCLLSLASMGGMVAVAVVVSPLVAAAAAFGSGFWPVFVVAAPAYGVVLAWLARSLAGRIGYRRLPELLAVVSPSL